MTMREICEIYIFEKYETRLNNLRIHFQPHSKHYNYTGLIHYLSSSQYAVYLMANRPVGSKSPENQIVGWMWPSFGLDQYCFSKKWLFVPFHRRNTNIRLKKYKTTLTYHKLWFLTLCQKLLCRYENSSFFTLTIFGGFHMKIIMMIYENYIVFKS